jgi:hypothetical protein
MKILWTYNKTITYSHWYARSLRICIRPTSRFLYGILTCMNYSLAAMNIEITFFDLRKIFLVWLYLDHACFDFLLVIVIN